MFLSQICDVFSNQRIVLGMISKMKTRQTSEKISSKKYLQTAASENLFWNLFRFFEDILEVAVCRRSAKSAYAFFSKFANI